MGVVVCIHLIAFEVDLERSTFFYTFVANVIEPLVADEFDGRGTEVRVELKHSFDQLDSFLRLTFELLCQPLPLKLALHLVCVNKPILIRQVRKILLTSLPNNFNNFDELIILAYFRRSITILKIEAWRNWIATGSLEQDSLIRISSIFLHLIREIHTFAKDAADAPNV